jgi:glycosyltransferase involved in cell wall biosynthesis
MRLLVVGHSYITGFAQSKYVAMKRCNPNLELRIVTPPEVGHVFQVYHSELNPNLRPDELVAIPRIFGRTHMTYIVNPIRLWRLIRTFKPDYIHIEEDPHSFIGIEAVTLARLACRQAQISFFIWDNLGRIPRFPRNVIKRWLTRFALANTALVICGNHEAGHLLRAAKGYRARVAVLPQIGLDAEGYASPPRPEISNQLARGSVWIGFVGRLVPEKGLRILFEALSGLSHVPWRLLVLGNGPLKNEIETEWRVRFGNRLLLIDAVPHADVPDFLKCLDIFVLPSYSTPDWKEQFGLTLAQAMLAGVACIGSASGAIPEVLDGCGVVVPERDAQSLAQALGQLCESADLRAQWGAKAQALARRRYTNEVVAAGHLSAFSPKIESPASHVLQHV